MSNALAIAAVTATLQSILTDKVTDDLPPGALADYNLGNTTVTTKSLDKARDSNETVLNQINLFLYQTTPNTAMSNMDMPAHVKPGETGQPPAALDLHYIVTAYGGNDNDTAAHILLGQVTRIFHDNAMLSRSEIQGALPGNDLHEQVERVRITAQPLSLEEVSKLWAAFQTNYRISAAYRVSVVLIESKRPAKTPLPVLTRGPADEGVVVQPDLTPPYPAIEEVVLPPHQWSARLGDALTLTGHHLDGAAVEVCFTHPRLTESIVLPPEPGPTAAQVKVKIPDVADDPDAPAKWPSGFYTVAVVVTEGEARVTNELSFALASRIESISPTTATGDFQLTVTCRPQVRLEQRVVLLFGSSEIPADPFSEPGTSSDATTLTFQIQDAAPGKYYIRLRVDGVDSLLVKYEGTPPKPVFDPDQKVEVS